MSERGFNVCSAAEDYTSSKIRKINTAMWVGNKAAPLLDPVKAPRVYTGADALDLQFLNQMLTAFDAAVLISANRKGSLKWYRLNSVPFDSEVVKEIFAIIKL